MSNTTTGPGTAWETNTSLGDIASALTGASSVLVLTHAKPDGDALGTTLALGRSLTSKGVRVTLAYTGTWPARFDPVVGATPILHANEATFETPPFDEPDAIAVLDTGSRSQLDAACGYVEARAHKTHIVDHHAHGDAALAHARHIDTKASAACLSVAHLCALVLGCAVSELPREIAEPLYLGCATDTGWFKHPNVTPERLMLMRRALDSLTFHDDGRVAVMSISQDDFKQTGAGLDDTGGLIDVPKTVGSIRVCALLTELDGITKVSFRSKAGEDAVDVNLVAQSLGGGGHKHAAGAKIPAPVGEARTKVLHALGLNAS